MLGVAGALVMRAASAPAAPAARAPLAMRSLRAGDGTLAGDMNFDPLGFSDSPQALAWYREAEIKHARLAMLAALGWPVSELTNFGGLLTTGGRAPALLNGGLDNVNAVYWAFVIALGAFAESKVLDKQFGKQQDYLPGQIGLDLLNTDSPYMRNAEILNGRVAMMAISIYALEEALTKAPIFPVSMFSAFRTIGAVTDAVGDKVEEAVSAVAAIETPALDALLAEAEQRKLAAMGEAVGDAAAAVGDAALAVGDAVGEAAA